MMRALILACAIGLATPALADIFDDQTAAPVNETWELDQLRVARSVTEAQLKPLEPAHTLDAAIKILNDLHIPFTRTKVRINVDRMPDALKARLLALPPGEPFIVPENEFWSISVIVGRALPPGAVRWTPAPSPRFAPSRKA